MTTLAISWVLTTTSVRNLQGYEENAVIVEDNIYQWYLTTKGSVEQPDEVTAYPHAHLFVKVVTKRGRRPAATTKTRVRELL